MTMVSTSVVLVVVGGQFVTDVWLRNRCLLANVHRTISFNADTDYCGVWDMRGEGGGCKGVSL